MWIPVHHPDRYLYYSPSAGWGLAWGPAYRRHRVFHNDVFHRSHVHSETRSASEMAPPAASRQRWHGHHCWYPVIPDNQSRGIRALFHHTHPGGTGTVRSAYCPSVHRWSVFGTITASGTAWPVLRPVFLLFRPAKIGLNCGMSAVMWPPGYWPLHSASKVSG